MKNVYIHSKLVIPCQILVEIQQFLFNFLLTFLQGKLHDPM